MKRPAGTVALGIVIAMLLWSWLSGLSPGMLKKDSLFPDMGGLTGEASPDNGKEGTVEDGDELTITGRVFQVEQRQSYGSSQLWIYLDSITIQEQNASVVEADISYHMICQTLQTQRPRLGSRVQMTGQFQTFTHATNPGQFDSAQYYRIQGIAGTLKNARLLAASKRYSHIKEGLFGLKEYWKQRLYACFPRKEASILNAMLLGDRTQLDSEIKELYQNNGIVHILSISGLHITLIGMGVYRLLRRAGCPVAAAAPAGGSLLVLYGIMTGMGVSASRAIGMYLIRMLGELLGRTYDMLTSLGIMAVILLAGNPSYLGHSGFLLSFGSICGIGMVMPVLEGKRTAGRPALRTGSNIRTILLRVGSSIRAAALPGLSVTLFTLPVQLYFYYEIPVYSIFLNLLVLPFMGAVMVVGMIVMLVPGLAFLGKLDVLILGGYEWLCRIFSRLPGHTWNPGAPKLWQIAAYYLLLAGCMLLHHKGRKMRCRVILLAGSIGLLGLHFPGQLNITFLDVGQGDCICVRTREEVYLFDCGSSSMKNVGEQILFPYLKHQGIGKIDGIFISHPDTDHVSGILELLTAAKEEEITIERLILPDLAQAARQEAFADIFEAAGTLTEELPISYMGAGTEWDSGRVHFTCLHPAAGSTLTDANAYSQCFLVKYGDFSMLLTGDVEGEGEEELLQVIRQCALNDLSLLKVAHHGSRYSTPEELLACLQPRIAVISCGRNNSYGHPHEELLERLRDAGCLIYQTQSSGAIRIQVTGEDLKIKTWQ